MGVPVLKLDLAPPSNLWRLNHTPLGWSALAAGGLLLAAALGFTWRAYSAAAAAGRQTVTLTAQTSRSAESERQILSELRNIDVAKELPRWRLAEKIFTERSLPWSRLTAELERSLVVDVRLKSVQRTRSSDMRVQLKLKGEARSREAEAAFVESLQKNDFFEQVLLERESERQGGGIDFEYTLAAQSVPPPFTPLPKRPKYATVKPAAKTPVMAARPAVGAARTPVMAAKPQPLRPVPTAPPLPLPSPLTGPPRNRPRRLDNGAGQAFPVSNRPASREQQP